MTEQLIEAWLEHRCTVETLQYVRAVCSRGPTNMELRECLAVLRLPRRAQPRHVALKPYIVTDHPLLNAVQQSQAVPEADMDDVVLNEKWVRRWARLLTVCLPEPKMDYAWVWRYWSNLRWAFLECDGENTVLQQRIYAAALNPQLEPLGFNLYAQRLNPVVLRAVLNGVMPVEAET